MDNEINSITLIDEDGNEVEFDVIMKLDIENKEYVIVAPTDNEEDDDDEAIALRIDKNEKGEDILVTVEDEKEFEMVSEAYQTLSNETELN